MNQILRKSLVKIKREYNNTDTRKKLFLYSGGTVLLSVIAAVLMDVFMPFGQPWNSIRTVVLIPLALSVFVLGYAVSLLLHYRLANSEREWVPFRERTSLMWRRNIALIAGAVLFVSFLLTPYSPVYTTVSSCILALGVGLLAYIRPYRDEVRREEMGIPDMRDADYHDRRKAYAEKRMEIAEEKARKREEKEERSFFSF